MGQVLAKRSHTSNHQTTTVTASGTDNLVSATGIVPQPLAAAATRSSYLRHHLRDRLSNASTPSSCSTRSLAGRIPTVPSASWIPSSRDHLSSLTSSSDGRLSRRALTTSTLLRSACSSRGQPEVVADANVTSTAFRLRRCCLASKSAAAAFKAVDERNAKKLKKILTVYNSSNTVVVGHWLLDKIRWLWSSGCKDRDHQRRTELLPDLYAAQLCRFNDGLTVAVVPDNIGHVMPEIVQLRSIPHFNEAGNTTLLEYAVEKNFIPGVELLLQPTTSKGRFSSQNVDAMTAAFMRSCDSGSLHVTVFNKFIEAAIRGCLPIDFHAAYMHLVDHFMYRKPFDLARGAFFDLATLETSLCRVTPLGLAVIHDDDCCIESFVRRGADIDGYDRDGNTALLRAAYGLKKSCMIKLLQLGADPNRRRCRPRPSEATVDSSTSLKSPLIAVCMAFGACVRTRTDLISALLASGLNLSADRAWITVVYRSGSPSASAVSRRLEDVTWRQLIRLSGQVLPLQTQCCFTIRRWLAKVEPGAVMTNIDRLPLPTTIRTGLKLENV